MDLLAAAQLQGDVLHAHPPYPIQPLNPTHHHTEHIVAAVSWDSKGSEFSWNIQDSFMELGAHFLLMVELSIKP